MLTGGLAKRYARALLDAASKEGSTERAADELRALAGFCSAESELSISLASPLVSENEKKKIITALFAGKTLRLTVDFLCLLVEKKRFVLLSAISEALDALIQDMKGIVSVSVASALPVDDRGRDNLCRRLEKMLGCTIQLTVAHIPALLCGIQIRIGDRFYDGSGLGRLAQIRTAMANC